MPRHQGYATIFDPDQGLKECDTYTCEHCNAVIHAPVNKHIEEVGDFCRSCMKVICLRCVGRPCIPFMKALEQREARDYVLRSYA